MRLIETMEELEQEEKSLVLKDDWGLYYLFNPSFRFGSEEQFFRRASLDVFGDEMGAPLEILVFPVEVVEEDYGV